MSIVTHPSAFKVTFAVEVGISQSWNEVLRLVWQTTLNSRDCRFCKPHTRQLNTRTASCLQSPLSASFYKAFNPLQNTPDPVASSFTPPQSSKGRAGEAGLLALLLSFSIFYLNQLPLLIILYEVREGDFCSNVIPVVRLGKNGNSYSETGKMAFLTPEFSKRQKKTALKKTWRNGGGITNKTCNLRLRRKQN